MGYSLGSYGTWTDAQPLLTMLRRPLLFRISGGSPASDFVSARLIDTPIFAFHSRDDASAPVSATRNVINSILKAADGQPIPTYLPTEQTQGTS